jgi:hypothetical protein
MSFFDLRGHYYATKPDVPTVGVPLYLGKRRMPGDGCNLIRAASDLSKSASRSFAESMRSSPFKTGAAETRRTRRNILENFREATRSRDREGGKWRIRFRRRGFSTYIPGTPWSEDFMRAYANAIDGVKAEASNLGAGRTVAGTVNALVAAYLDPRISIRTFPARWQICV